MSIPAKTLLYGKLSNLSEAGLIKIDDAVDIARSLLHDYEYGYSIDDLVVEANGFMQDKKLSEDDLYDILYGQSEE